MGRDGMGWTIPVRPLPFTLPCPAVLVPLNSSLGRPALDGWMFPNWACWLAGLAGPFITYDQLFFRPPQGRVPVCPYLSCPSCHLCLCPASWTPKPRRWDKIKTAANICASPPPSPLASRLSPLLIPSLRSPGSRNPSVSPLCWTSHGPCPGPSHCICPPKTGSGRVNEIPCLHITHSDLTSPRPPTTSHPSRHSFVRPLCSLSLSLSSSPPGHGARPN